MPHIVDTMLAEADAAIATMQQAALRARALHARAELLRHMRGTAAKMSGRPADEAAALVAGEWMKAWHLDGDAYADIAGDVRHFTDAFVRDAQASTPATQAAIRTTTDALDEALARHGTTLADQMAWRSQCAHGWWSLVAPYPPGYPERPTVPAPAPGAPFWQAGCAEQCK